MNIRIKLTALGALAGVISAFGNGCGQIGVFEANTESLSSLSVPDSIEGKPIPLSSHLQTGEQILKSMLTVTGLTITDPTNSDVIRQFEATASIFSPGFSYQNYTAPMGVAVASLASVVCNQVIAGELSQPRSPAVAKDVYSSIRVDDRTLEAFSEAEFIEHLNYMGLKYYGRPLSASEISKFLAARVEFESEVVAADKRTLLKFRDFLLFNCTAMLSSFDFLFI